MIRFTKIAAIAVFSSLASAALAGDIHQKMEQTVSYADLDLATPAGMAVLNARIKMAASKVCGGAPDTRELGQWYAYQSCSRRAASDAMTMVSTRLAADRSARVAAAR